MRIWPHKMEGEGHFLALLKKKEAVDALAGGCGASWREADQNTADPYREREECARREDILPEKQKERKGGKGRKNRRKGADGTGKAGAGGTEISREDQALLRDFLRETGTILPEGRLENRSGRLFLVRELPDSVRGLHFLRNGLYLGELKKNRFEPSQPLAMALAEETCSACLRFPEGDTRLEAYLRGESVTVEDAQKPGWKLVCAGRFPLGWGKLSGGLLKNKYLNSWRKTT